MSFHIGAITFIMIIFVDGLCADDTAVEELRQLVLNGIKVNPDHFHHKDIAKIKTVDNLLKRFNDYHNGNLPRAATAMIKAMKWRKSFGVNDWTDNTFPEEFYKMGTNFPFGWDRDGRRIFVVRVRGFADVSDKWTDLLIKFLIYLIDKMCDESDRNGNTGIALLMDCTGVSFTSNVKFNHIQFLLSLLEYFPKLIRSILVLELPSTINFAANVIIKWLPEQQKKLLHFISNNELDKYVAKDQIPDFIGGTSKMSYRTVPSNVTNARDLGHRLGFNDFETDKLLGHLKPFIDGKV